VIQEIVQGSDEFVEVAEERPPDGNDMKDNGGPSAPCLR